MDDFAAQGNFFRQSLQIFPPQKEKIQLSLRKFAGNFYSAGKISEFMPENTGNTVFVIRISRRVAPCEKYNEINL